MKVTELIKNLLKFSIFLGVGVLILWLLYQNLDTAYQAQCKLDGIPEAECSLLRKVANDFQNANYFWIIMVLASFTFSNISRALRWKMLIKPLGYNISTLNAFFMVMLGYFANLGLPRMGEIVRSGAMARYENIPVEKVIGTVVVDRILDVMCLLLMVGLSFVLAYKSLWEFLEKEMDLSKFSALLSSPYLWTGFVLFGVLLVLLWMKRAVILESKLFKKVYKILQGFGEGLQSIRQIDNLPVFLLHTFNIWLMYFLMTYLCFFAFAPTEHLGPLAGLLVFVFGAFGFVIPSPGGMGTYHILSMAALAIFGINEIDAFSFANISFFSINIGCNVLLGVLSLLLLPVFNKRKA